MAGKTSFFNQSGLAGVAYSTQSFDSADGNALQYVRLNAAESSMEFRTIAETLADLGLEIGVDVQAYDATYLVDADIGVTVEAYDATILKDADIGVTVQAYDATYLVDADIGVNVQAYDATYLVDADIGVTVQAYDATYLVDADIGSTVQAYDATLQSLSSLGTAADKIAYTTGVNTWAETSISLAGRNLLDDATFAAMRTSLGLVIGADVQAYDATIVVDADIGVSVQAYDADTAKTDVVDVWTAGQAGEVTALSDGASIALDLALSNNFSVTLAGNRTLANPTNIVAGQSGLIAVTQDATGSRTLAYGTYYKFAGGTAPTLTTTASAVDTLAYYVKSSTEILVSAALDWS